MKPNLGTIIFEASWLTVSCGALIACPETPSPQRDIVLAAMAGHLRRMAAEFGFDLIEKPSANVLAFGRPRARDGSVMDVPEGME